MIVGYLNHRQAWYWFGQVLNSKYLTINTNKSFAD